MKTNIRISFLVFLILGLVFTELVFSQSVPNGGIRGQVKGSDTKSPLPYAIVMVVGTNNGTTTDVDGNFILSNVNPGKQQIKISYVGYIDTTLDVEVKSGKIAVS